MFTLAELAERFDCEVVGDPNCKISNIGTLTGGGPGDISFLSNPKYRKFLKDTSVAAVILSKDSLEDCPTNSLITKDPYVVYAKIAALISQHGVEHKSGIHPKATVNASAEIDDSAYIGPNCVIKANVRIGANTHVGPGCVIGKDVQVGDGCMLIANVTLCESSIVGNRNILHPGVVIGSDGFGLANDNGKWIKIPQLGRARLGDDVEVGANTCIDRGAIEDTVIEDGVKLDNLIQIAHNVRIGAHTAIAAGTGIAGSVKIGKHCGIGGKVGIVGHLEIADNVQVTAMSLVTNSIKESGTYSSGTPLENNAHWQRNSVRFKQLDEMARRLKKLEKQLDDKT